MCVHVTQDPDMPRWTEAGFVDETRLAWWTPTGRKDAIWGQSFDNGVTVE